MSELLFQHGTTGDDTWIRPTSDTATPQTAGYLDGTYRPVFDGTAMPYESLYADSGDYTFAPRMRAEAVVRFYGDNPPLTYDALVATVYRLQNELAGVESQLVELRERLAAWEADS